MNEWSSHRAIGQACSGYRCAYQCSGTGSIEVPFSLREQKQRSTFRKAPSLFMHCSSTMHVMRWSPSSRRTTEEKDMTSLNPRFKPWHLNSGNEIPLTHFRVCTEFKRRDRSFQMCHVAVTENFVICCTFLQLTLLMSLVQLAKYNTLP